MTRWRGSTGPPAWCGRSWAIFPAPSWRQREGGATGPATGWSRFRPGRDGAWVTSQRAVVSSVDLAAGSLVAVTPEGTELHMGPGDIGADKLAHAYSVTAHRSQGQTVDATYALEDGGGRELAYVAMSRARGESHVHVVAPDIRHAARRLAWAWGQERRQRWAHSAVTGGAPGPPVPRAPGAAGLAPSRPLGRPRPGPAPAACRRAGHRRPARRHRPLGRIPLPGRPPVTSSQAAVGYQRASEDLEAGDLGPWGRHKARRQLREASARFGQAKQAWEQHGRPYADQLEATRVQLTRQADELEQAQQAREAFLAKHPDVPHRLAELGRAIEHEQEVQRGQSYSAYCNESRLATCALRTRRTPAGGSTCDAQPAVLPSGPRRLPPAGAPRHARAS